MLAGASSPSAPARKIAVEVIALPERSFGGVEAVSLATFLMEDVASPLAGEGATFGWG